MDKGVGWLQKLLNLQNKYGFFSIVKGLFLVLLGGYVVFFALNPKFLLERITKIQTEEHSDLVETRLKSDTEISNILCCELLSNFVSLTDCKQQRTPNSRFRSVVNCFQTLYL